MLHLLVVAIAAFGAAAPAPDATIQLFNGKDLTNFYTFLKNQGRDTDPQGVFTVQDGMLHITGDVFGCVTTTEEYENYRLVVEFKWGDRTTGVREGKARDSGVLLHSTGPDGGFSGTWMYSLECQMIEGGTGDLLVVGDGTDKYSLTCTVAPEKAGESYVYQPDGKPATAYSGRINWYGRDPEWKDEKGYRGRQDVEKPAGEWNVYDITADGATITVKLNGTVVNRAIDAKPHRGRIQIQSEGAEVFVRKVELTPLPAKP